MKRIGLAIAFWCLCGAAWSQPAPPYTLENTEVLDVHARELDRDYQLFVSLPASYAKSTRRYPVVFVSDAGYTFPLIRSIGGVISRHSNDMDEFILVGLSYAKGETGMFSRRRDYTPGDPMDPGLRSVMPGRAPQFGQAEGYRRFIASEVFPLVARRYRADMGHKVFAGESYGALLGTHILLAAPGMFEYYVLGSPSLWFGKHTMFARERAYAAAHRDLKANVYFSVGGLETGEEDMVGDMRRFVTALRSRHYPGLHIESKVFADEGHLTVFPGIATRGLKWALPPQK